MREVSTQRAKELLANKGLESLSVTAVKETTPGGSHEPSGDQWNAITAFEDGDKLVIGIPSGPSDA